jgi:glycosyltransferase involved in cell wall biosynthesis
MNWSVPASVDAQSKIDNVLWVEMSDARMDHWTKVGAYHNYKEFPGKGLNRFPAPFSRPDVVIFEGFYFLNDFFLSRELKKKKIPYIIIPRGSLTYIAIHNKSHFKKKIANFLFFRKFVKDAAAVQFLTQNECDTSLCNFPISNYFIIPNGVIIPPVEKKEFGEKGIRGAFIGRLDIVHKGLDLLLESLSEIKDELRSIDFSLAIYGPESFDYKSILKLIHVKELDDFVSLKGVISGEEKRKALLSTDIFIMTSRFEGHPMGLIEALSYGVPCLITQGTNMKSEVDQYQAGWTCENSVESIKAALMKFVSERRLLPDKGKKARALSEKYGWHKLADDFHNQISIIVKQYGK